MSGAINDGSIGSTHGLCTCMPGLRGFQGVLILWSSEEFGEQFSQGVVLALRSGLGSRGVAFWVYFIRS